MLQHSLRTSLESAKLFVANNSCAEDHAQDDGDDTKDDHDDAEAPPFHLAGTPCVFDALG
jgi:hypothetical protein